MLSKIVSYLNRKKNIKRLSESLLQLKAQEAKTQKRSITKEDVYKLIAVDVEEGSYPFHAKNFFLFSYYCSGMNFIDAANLSWSDINSK